MSIGRAGAFGVAVLSCVLLIAGCGGAASRHDSHMRRGQAYFDKGDFTKANIEFRNAMQISPNDPESRLMAARTAEKLGRLRDAVGFYQSVVDLAPQNTAARANLGRIYVLAGEPDRALELVQPALAKHPDDPELLTTRAAARLQKKDPSGARADAERAVQVAPANENAAALLAAILRQANEFPQAEAVLVNTLTKVPTSSDLHQVLASLYLAGDQPAKAEEQFRKLVELKPRALAYRIQLAVYYSRSRRLDDAQQTLEEAVKVLPDSDDAKLALVDFLVAQRTREQGEKTLRKYIDSNPTNSQLRLGLGSLLEHNSATKEAIDAYNEIIRREGYKAQGLAARDRIALIYEREGRYDDAQKLADEVLQQNPQDSDALTARANIALAKGDPTTAIADLRTVLRNHPEAVAVQRTLARAHLANGEPALAEEALRTAMDTSPTDVGARVQLAQLLVQTQRSEQAVALLEEAVSRTPNDLAVREGLVRAYIGNKDFAAARTGAEDIKALRPTSALGFYLAGIVAQGQNRLDDSRKELQHALELQPTAVDALTSLARLELVTGHGAEAVARVQSELDHDPKNPVALNLLGELYLALKDIPHATDALTRAAAAAPKWWLPYRMLGMTKLSANDVDGAVKEYDAAINAAPSELQPVLEVAEVLETHGRPNDAIARYEALYARNPRVDVVANNLAVLLVTYRTDSASLDRARDLTATFATSDNGALLDTHGWVRYKRGEYANALPVLERAAVRAPDLKIIRYHLAMAELRSGQRDRARVNLETALSGPGTFTGADEARSMLASLKNTSG